MDLNSTRTDQTALPDQTEKPPIGKRLLDSYVKNADHYAKADVSPDFLARHAYKNEGASSGLDFNTWATQNGVNDFLANAPVEIQKRKEQKQWEADQPESRGFLSGTKAALGRGAMNAVRAMGETLSLADATPGVIDTDKGVLDRAGEGMINWAEEKKAKAQSLRPTKQEESGETSYAKRSWEGGVESMATSVAPMAAGYAGSKAGAALGAVGGPVGMAVGGTIGGLGAYALARFGMFGAGVYGDTYDKTYKELKQTRPEMSEDEVRNIAHKGALTDTISENLSEAVGDAAAFATFGGTKILQQPLTATVKDVMKRGIKRLAGDVAKQMPFEVGSEMANAAVGAQWRNEAGLSGGDMKEAVIESIGPAVVMSLLMGGGVAGYTEVKARKALSDINNLDNPEVRHKTANEVALQVKERTGEDALANDFLAYARDRIDAGEQIDINEQLVKFGANRARLDAAETGQDIAVVPDESEVQQPDLSPAEQMLTDGQRRTPEDVLLGTDPIIPEPFNPAAQSPVIDQQRRRWEWEAAQAQDEQAAQPLPEREPEIIPSAVQDEGITQDQWEQRQSDTLFDLQAQQRRDGLRAAEAEKRRQIANLERLGNKISPTQQQNLTKHREALALIEADLSAMDQQADAGLAMQAEMAGVEEFAPATVQGKETAGTLTSATDKENLPVQPADLPSAGTVTAPVQAEASKKEPWQMTRDGYYQHIRDIEGAGKSNARAWPDWSEIKKSVGFDFAANGNEVQPLPKQRLSGGFSTEQEAAIKDALSAQGFAVDKIRVRNNEEQDIPDGEGWRSRSRDVLPTSPEHERAVRKAISEGKPVPPEVLAEYPDLAPPTLPADQRPTIDERIAEAEGNGVVLSDADKKAIRETATRAENFRKTADRLSASDPMNKGNSFPAGVGYTKMTKRKEQAIDSSVRKATEAVEIYKKAEREAANVEAMLSGKGTEADREQKKASREKSRSNLATAILGYKRGDKLREYTVERVSNDKDGYPASITVSGEGVVKGVSDKINIVKELFDGDKVAYRKAIDDARKSRVQEGPDQETVLSKTNESGYVAENKGGANGREAEGAGKQEAASVGQRIQQGDEGQVADNQEADSRVDDERMERSDETVVYVADRPLLDEWLDYADRSVERLVSEGYLTEAEAASISDRAKDTEEYQLWELEDELAALKETRDHEINLSKNVIARILKAGGINHAHAVERMGGPAVADLRRKLGFAITRKNGEMLDNLAISITESFPDIGLNNDMDELVDLLQNRLQSQAQINREYEAARGAVLAAMKDIHAKLAERLAYREGDADVRADAKVETKPVVAEAVELPVAEESPQNDVGDPSFVKRSKRTVDFSSNPIVGPSGAKVTGYEWRYRIEDVEVKGGEDVVGKRVSDWSSADTNSETGRDIVHLFSVDMPDGKSKTASLETALKLLGFTKETDVSAEGRSIISAAKTVARLRMEISEQQRVIDEYNAALREIKATEKPGITIDGKWAIMGDARVRLSDGLTEERRERLGDAWVSGQMSKRGHATSNPPTNKLRDLQSRLQKAENLLARIDAQKASNNGMRKATKAGLARVADAKKAMAAVVNNPDIVGKDRADRIENARNLVNFLEANAANDLDTGYEFGDMVAYTGDNAPEGMRAFIYLDGAKAGKTGVAATKETRDARTAKAQDDWKRQQEEFARLKQDATKPDAATTGKPEKAAGKKGEKDGDGTADAGQELTQNKRNRMTRGLKWEDLKDMNATLRTKEAVKAKIIPKPDYQAMIDGGTNPVVVHIFKQVYDAIAAKPKPISLAQTADDAAKLYIDSANRVMDEARKWVENGGAARWVKSMADGLLARNKKGPFSISDYAKREREPGPYEILYPDGWRAARDEINILGGNRFLAGIQPGEEGLASALKDIDKGWPGTVPAWKKQGYSIVKIGEMKPTFYVGEDHKKQPYVYVHFSEGRNSAESVLVRGATSATDTRVLEAVAQGRKMYDGKFALLSKGRKVVSAHDTEADAIAAAEAVTKKKTGAGGIKEEGYSVEASSRTGVEHRMNGEDITSDQLMKTFGFKGVNFGNWMKGKGNEAERQIHLNLAYDSFMDLAQILNVPPRAISLNGLLGLAIGAQGGGKYAAHFIPGVNEINLTRTSGAGAVAHEWAHGLDHYFANTAGRSRSEDPFITEHTRSSNAAIGELRVEVMDKIAAIVKAMNKSPMSRDEIEAQANSFKNRIVSNIDSWIRNMRSSYMHGLTDGAKINKNGKTVDFAEEFDRIADRIRTGDVEQGKIAVGRSTFFSPVVAELRDLYMLKKVGDQKPRAYSIDDFKSLQANVDSLLYSMSEKAHAKTHEPQLKASDYANESVKADGNKGGRRYWSTNLEMFARAFAGYVYDKLEQQKSKNTYLVRPRSADGEVNAYAPVGAERKRINEAFDALIKELKTKETDKGVALYQTATSTPTAVDIRAAFPWADSIVERDGKTIVTKGKVSFAIEQVERIDADNVAFQAGYGRGMGAGEEIAGAYLQGKSTIRLSRVADQWAVAHEYEHFLEDMGLITKFEQAVLDAAVKKAEKDGTLAFDPGQGQSRMKPAELRAYYVQHALIARDFQRKTTLGRVLQKVADFVDALVNLAVRTSRGVVRGVESGKMMDREPTSTPQSSDSYQTAQAAGAKPDELADAARLWEEMGTESPYFKKWFGKSKVVDKNGKPLVVYHGTSAEFEAFEKGKNKFSITSGFYFSPHSDVSKNFAQGETGKIYSAYIVIKNPYVAKDYMEIARLSEDKIAHLKSLGHDGVYFKPKDESLYYQEEFAVFDPTQIKSAIGNRGTFDPTDPRIQYSVVSKARELKDDIMTRPEVFGVFKSINTQLHKALRQPAFKRIFDRFHAAAGTQQRAAARAASFAPDILPDHSGNFMQSVRELFTKTRDFSIADLKHVSQVMSMETLSGKDASPFSGRRLTDVNRADFKSDAEYEAALEKTEVGALLRGETVTLGGKDVAMSDKQVKLYRQSRAALDQMLTEMATSEAWRVMRGVLTKHQSTAGEFDAKDYWEVFADQPNEAANAMKEMLDRELVKAQARLTRAETDALSISNSFDMDGFREYGKKLTKLNIDIDNKEKFSQKQLEDGDLDEIIAKREAKIDRLADEIGVDANEAEERLKEYKAALKEYDDATQNVSNVKDVQSKVADIFTKSDQLIKAGYAPLSRFGEYRIDVRTEAGELIHTSFYDTSTEANRERRKLVAAFEDYPNGAVVGEVKTLSQEAWKQFQGANPEALMLFAEKAGADSKDVLQAFYQDAVSSRSALKRLINRKGYAGYSEDLQRITASFITSGAKRVSQNYHAADITEMMNDKDLPADLFDEAFKLKSFIDNPGDAGSAFRSFAANWYMLGSFMSAAWNGTQVVTSSLPELYKHGGSIWGATKDVTKAYRTLVRKGKDLSITEQAALKRAMEDGTVDSAEIHHLYAQATKRFINKLGDGEAAKRVGAFLRLWGMPFAWFEVTNRKATFIAAYRMAEAQGREDAYEFAKQVVDITQGVYNKHNRPNVARSAVGGAVLTFMQYKIMTLEQIARNAKEGGQARKAAALQLAIIAALGGWKALPGVEDIADLYDTIMQVIFDRATIGKKSLREGIEKKSVEAAGLILEKEAADVVGKFFANAVNNGIVTATLPVDVSGRAAMGSLIPGLKLLKPSTQYRDSVVFDMAGVPGSMIDSLIDATGMMLEGNMGRAAMRLAPNAVASVVKGGDILSTGEIKNTRGKVITEGTPLNAAIQMVGGQPKEKTRINTRVRENQELKALTQKEERSIVAEWADAYEKKGVVAQREALIAVRQRIADWNKTNPDWPIVVKQSQVMNELKNRKKTTAQLAAKSAPKELRPSMAVE